MPWSPGRGSATAGQGSQGHVTADCSSAGSSSACWQRKQRPLHTDTRRWPGSPARGHSDTRARGRDPGHEGGGQGHAGPDPGRDPGRGPDVTAGACAGGEMDTGGGGGDRDIRLGCHVPRDSDRAAPSPSPSTAHTAHSTPGVWGTSAGPQPSRISPGTRRCGEAEHLRGCNPD